jgi:putative ABC transport system ATP-binding protein
MEKEFFEDKVEIEDKDLLFEIKNKQLVIVAKNLVKYYEIGDFLVRAVDHVSLKVKDGDFIVIKGHSGAGKTTLLNLIAGLDKPEEGVIFSYGVKISSMADESLTLFRLMNSGFIFQNYNLISTLTAEENIMFPMNLAGMKLNDQRKRATELLSEMKLNERREHLPFQLSAGEQQRVAIARALANNPPLLLADEPTANLDKRTSDFIIELFQKLKQEERTIIMVTHDDSLIDISDHVIKFEDGKIVDEN